MEPIGVQLAKDGDSLQRRSLFAMEPKLDGHRLLVGKLDGKTVIYTRTYHSQVGKFPLLEKAIAQVPFDFLLDGEAVHVTSTVEFKGQQVPLVSWSGTQSVIGASVGNSNGNRLTFLVFDCLLANNEDIRSMKDFQRYQIATAAVEMLAGLGAPVLQVPRWTTWKPEDFDAMVALGCEGIMLKNPRAPYRSNHRSEAWLKFKAEATADVVIMGFTPGKGKYANQIGAIEFGQMQGGKLVKRGKCSGMTDALRIKFSQNPQGFIGTVIEVKYNGHVGAAGVAFRHPRYLRPRLDKLPKDCSWT